MPEMTETSPQTLFDHAAGHMAAGRIGEAEAAYLEVLEECRGKTSKDMKGLAGQAAEKLGQISLDLGALPEAQWRFEEAKELGRTGVPLARGFAETCFGLGFDDKAKKAWQQVLKENPEDNDAHIGLGRLAMKQRDFEAARKHFKRAKGAMAALELGLLEEALENRDKARGFYLKALTGEPGFYDKVLALADKFLFLDVPEMARFYLYRAEKIAPPDPFPFYAIGYRYFTLGFMADAARAFEAHIAMRPTLKGFRELADVYEKTNRVEKALKTLETPFRYFPDDPRINYLAAVCEIRQGKTKEAIARLEKSLGKAGDDHLSEAEILNALGKANDREGDFKTAGSFFSSSKRALQKTDDFKNLDAGVIPALIETQRGFDWRALDRASEAGDEPVFLLGFHRSGTTLIQHILDAHEDIESAEEKGILEGVMAAVDKREGGYPLALQRLRAADFNLLRRLYNLWARVHGKTGAKVFVDKNPLNVLHPALISALFPKAKIIFAQRNPYAVVVSCWMQNFTLNPATANMLGLEAIVTLYQNTMGLWQEAEKTRNMAVHRIRYEDLVTDIEAETRTLCKFLGLKVRPGMADFHKTAKAREQINTASYAQVIKPLYRAGVSHWQNYRPALAPYKKTLDPLCKALGYEPLD